MKAIRLNGKAATEADIKGRVLVHDLGPELRKGSILRAADLPRVQQVIFMRMRPPRDWQPR